MKRIYVESSNIKSIGYDEIMNILQVEFKNGSIYNYFDIPKIIYTNLINAESHGKYLDKYIKKSGFKYEKVK